MYLLITCGIALLVIIILQNTTYHPLNTSRSGHLYNDDYYVFIIHTKYKLYIIVVVIITNYMYKYIIH